MPVALVSICFNIRFHFSIRFADNLPTPFLNIFGCKSDSSPKYCFSSGCFLEFAPLLPIGGFMLRVDQPKWRLTRELDYCLGFGSIIFTVVDLRNSKRPMISLY